MPKGKIRGSQDIPTSSMADIAFLLLIFFLVATKIEVDKGISVRLPQWTDEKDTVDVVPRNVFIVLVNSRDQLLVEGQLCPIEDLRGRTKRFITNNGKDPTLSDSPQEATVSFKADKGTTYETYIKVYNELKGAYNELFNEQANLMYGQRMADLDTTQQRQVKLIYPWRLSEAEPSDIASQTR